MVSITGCSTILEREILTNSTEVIKSPADDRDYRYLTLDNGLGILLISDADTDKAAAAVDVNVGSYQDPENRLGLAHFLEHMLFMGTEKYPDVDSYSEFIRAHGGSSNAYTADVRTNYFFDINSDQLQPALDRLAQFFISPKLDPAYVEREKNAVDSEYRLHAREDGWRLLMAMNATSNSEHPKSRFNIGSLDTLNNDDGQLWQSLKNFYDTYYVAPNMGVVVYGREPLDTLENWVKTSFSAVPGGTKPNQHIGKPPYVKDELGVRINIVPLKDIRVLSLSFPVPSVQPYYRNKPLSYLSRIVGYEGKGSLHSLLKSKGWIDSLAAYNSDLPGEYSEFTVRMELTPGGLKNVDAITEKVFDYFEQIRKNGLQSRLYEESKQVAELGFRFQEDRSPQQTVSALAARMHYLPPARLLDVNYLYDGYNPELIQDYLIRMTPQNLRQVVIAQGLKTDKVEPYFETHYRMVPLSASLMKRLATPTHDDQLTIPEPNPFIARHLDLVNDSKEKQPEVILDKPGLRLWSLTDTSFGMPRGNVRVMVSSSKASDTPTDNVLVQLYKSLLSRSLNEYGYPAKEAGLNYGISAGRRGIMLSLSGYSDKQSILLDAMLKGIKDFKPKAAAFEQEKAILLRALKNKQFQTPYRLGIDVLSQLAYPSYPEDGVLLKAAEKVTFKQLQQYATDFYQHIHIEMLVLGNYAREDALKLGDEVSSNLLTDRNAAKRFDLDYHLLGDTDRVVTMDIEHDDSMVISYYQMPETGNRERAQYALLGRLLANPFFNALRTEQQLGYVVFAGPRPFEQRPGIIFVVQSPKLDPIGLEQRIDAFLESQKTALVNLTDAELKQYQQGLIVDLLKKDDNLDDRNGRFWSGIISGETNFDNRLKIADEIRKLTPAGMRAALNRLLENRGKLVVRSFGKPHKKAYKKEASRKECFSTDCFDDLPLTH